MSEHTEQPGFDDILQQPAQTDELLTLDQVPADHRSGFVAVAGRPNVGKSTLINGWLGQKIAAVSPKPQTTRQRLMGILTRPDVQVIFLDTPGLHKPQHRLGEFMVDQAQQALPDADVICLVVDGSVAPGPADRLVAQDVAARASGVPVVLAINKVDLMPASAVEERTTTYRALFPNAADWTVISALDEAGRADLLERIVRLLPLGPRYFPEDQVTDLQERFIAAEMIREQVLLLTYQEVPHSVAVLVDEFKERPDGLTYVSATIYVERDTQKRIVLGQGGQMIKQIGQGARVQIEEMVGSKVYLELWVKVWEQWRKKDSRLRYLGYALPQEQRPPGNKRRR
ncbi:MAG TPA: GTPase Era [Anaerolineae bacterium]|nr:GTPase Era [Anaerolineae bacterium]